MKRKGASREDQKQVSEATLAIRRALKDLEKREAKARADKREHIARGLKRLHPMD